MKKRVIFKSLLILLPVLAVGLATTQNSVTVFDTVTGQTQYYSYFDLVPVTNLQMMPPMAALCAALSGIFAAVYLGKQNPGMLKAAGYAAGASACLAAIPTVMREAVLVIPNVGLPVFMALQFICCSMLTEKTTAVQTEEIKKNKNTKNNKKKSKR